MKQLHITLSFGRLFTGLAVVAMVVGVSTSGAQPTLVNSTINYPPVGSFGTLTCAWNSSNTLYIYTIPASWSDRNNTGSDPSNGYLGNKNSKAANGDNLTPQNQALDHASKNGPSSVWTFDQSVIKDTDWPVRLFAHNVPATDWPLVATANRPSCPPLPTAPSGGGGGGTGGSTGTTKKTTSSGSGTTVPAPSAAADGTVAVGTASAVITVPADGASKLHITYSAGSGGPGVATDDVAVSGDHVDVTLTDLLAATGYSFQIVRSNSAGASAASAAANFSTTGYNVALKFTDAHGKPVAGIEGSIDDTANTTAKSDTDGTMKFSGLTDGTYRVSYTYHGRAYTKDFDTTSSTANPLKSDGTPATITLTDTINVAKLTAAGANSGTGKSSGVGHVLLVLLLLAIVGTGGWFGWKFWRNKRAAAVYSRMSEPAATIGAIDNRSLPGLSKTPPLQQPLPTHAGQSLADLVIQSMREQPAPTNAPAVPGHAGGTSHQNPLEPPHQPPPQQ